jgi:hypothetical protein
MGKWTNPPVPGKKENLIFSNFEDVSPMPPKDLPDQGEKKPSLARHEFFTKNCD